MQEPGTLALTTFLRRELDAVVPLISPSEAAELAHDLSNTPLGQSGKPPISFERALAAAKTKTWRLNFSRQGKQILCSAYDFGQWTSLAPLIQDAVKDPRIGALTFFGGGPAAMQFEQIYGARAVNLSDLGETALAAFSLDSTFDIAVATISGRFGPDAWILTNAKSILDAKKLVLIYDIYAAVPQSIPSTIDPIDLVICSDHLTRECFLQSDRWGIPASKVVIAKTGQTVTSELDASATILRQEGIRKLGLDGDEIVVSLLGDMTVEREWGEGLSVNLAEESLRDALLTIQRVAQLNPTKKYAAIIRPHPADPGRARLEALMGISKLSENLKFRYCAPSAVAVDELAACSDAICSLYSTESFKAADRGITGVFLNASYFDQFALAPLKLAVQERRGLKVVKSQAEFEAIVDSLQSGGVRMPIAENSNGTFDAMLELLLASE